MSETDSTQHFRRPTLVGASFAVLALALAACSSASPSPSAAGNESQAAGESQVANESQAAAGRCAVTADASPNATIQIASLAFGGEATIQAGQAVVFTNQDVDHTVTEGTGGQAAADACVDEPIGGGQSVIVTFNEPGDYQITCTIHPPMQTVVHVE